MANVDAALRNPTRTLTALFITWKVFLISAALFSPGAGYDASTSQSFDTIRGSQSLKGAFGDPSWLWASVASKLTRWDAIYFVSSSSQGYVYEQQWAFGWGFSKLVSFSSTMLAGSGRDPMIDSLVAIVIAHISHLLSVLVLYRLAFLLSGPYKRPHFSLIAASLHIVAPAGLFLSAPNAESLFSLLNFSGFLAYSLAKQGSAARLHRPARSHLLVIVSGMIFGLASTIRSNGLLSGLLYLYDIVRQLPALASSKHRWVALSTCVSTGFAGLAIIVGFAGPQTLAFFEYCIVAEDARPWCRALPPIIYTFVQARYWNVGFLKYWTLSNLPLFVLAMPMLFLLSASALDAMSIRFDSSTSGKSETGATHSDTVEALYRGLALPQLLLVFLALTTSHVQIVNRIAIGYPLVNLWIARRILQVRNGRREKLVWCQCIVRWMIMYAVIQGGLFASFLPPA